MAVFDSVHCLQSTEHREIWIRHSRMGHPGFSLRATVINRLVRRIRLPALNQLHEVLHSILLPATHEGDVQQKVEVRHPHCHYLHRHVHRRLRLRPRLLVFSRRRVLEIPKPVLPERVLLSYLPP
jgi:hypothetical protein